MYVVYAQDRKVANLFDLLLEFSVPQIEYTPGGSSKKGSHVYFLLIVAMALLLWRQVVLLWHHNNIYIRQ